MVHTRSLQAGARRKLQGQDGSAVCGEGCQARAAEGAPSCTGEHDGATEAGRVRAPRQEGERGSTLS